MSAPVLLAYQQEWIADRAAIKVAEKSRQIGLTWSEAADAVLTAGTKGGQNYYYISYNEDMTKTFIQDCRFWIEVYNIAAEETQEILVDGPGGTKISAFQIPFASGKVIQALSSRARNIRSKRGTLCIDEAGFCDELRALLKAAVAFTMWGGRIRIISTHNGDENPFNELIQEIREGKRKYSLHKITLDDAIRDGLCRKILEKTERAWTPAAEEAWRQNLIDDYGEDANEELFCIPKRSGGRYIPRSTIEAAMREGVPVIRWACSDEFALMPAQFRYAEALAFLQDYLDPILTRLPNLPTFLGEDFGRFGDLTVLWFLQRLQNCSLMTPFVVELRNVPYKQQEQILFYILDRLVRFYGGHMDRRGNGEFLAEVAQQRYGSRIEGVPISLEWYQVNMPRLKAGLEDGTLTIAQDGDHLDDLRAVTVVKGVPVIPDVKTVAKGEETGPEGSKKKGKPKRHGDAAVALCMANAAARDMDSGPAWVEHGPRREMAILTELY